MDDFRQMLLKYLTGFLLTFKRIFIKLWKNSKFELPPSSSPVKDGGLSSRRPGFKWVCKNPEVPSGGTKISYVLLTGLQRELQQEYTLKRNGMVVGKDFYVVDEENLRNSFTMIKIHNHLASGSSTITSVYSISSGKTL